MGGGRLPAEFLAGESFAAATRATTLGGGEKRPGVLGVPDDWALAIGALVLGEGRTAKAPAFWTLWTGVAGLDEGLTTAILLPTSAAPGIGVFFSEDLCCELWFCCA